MSEHVAPLLPPLFNEQVLNFTALRIILILKYFIAVNIYHAINIPRINFQPKFRPETSHGSLGFLFHVKKKIPKES